MSLPPPRPRSPDGRDGTVADASLASDLARLMAEVGGGAKPRSSHPLRRPPGEESTSTVIAVDLADLESLVGGTGLRDDGPMPEPTSAQEEDEHDSATVMAQLPALAAAFPSQAPPTERGMVEPTLPPPGTTPGLGRAPVATASVVPSGVVASPGVLDDLSRSPSLPPAAAQALRLSTAPAALQSAAGSMAPGAGSLTPPPLALRPGLLPMGLGAVDELPEGGDATIIEAPPESVSQTKIGAPVFEPPPRKVARRAASLAVARTSRPRWSKPALRPVMVAVWAVLLLAAFRLGSWIATGGDATPPPESGRVAAP